EHSIANIGTELHPVRLRNVIIYRPDSGMHGFQRVPSAAAFIACIQVRASLCRQLNAFHQIDEILCLEMHKSTILPVYEFFPMKKTRSLLSSKPTVLKFARS